MITAESVTSGQLKTLTIIGESFEPRINVENGQIIEQSDDGCSTFLDLFQHKWAIFFNNRKFMLYSKCVKIKHQLNFLF